MFKPRVLSTTVRVRQSNDNLTKALNVNHMKNINLDFFITPKLIQLHDL